MKCKYLLRKKQLFTSSTQQKKKKKMELIKKGNRNYNKVAKCQKSEPQKQNFPK